MVEGAFSGVNIQSHIHDAEVVIWANGKDHHFTIFFKNHISLPENKSAPKIASADHPWRGDILLMRRGHRGGYVNVRSEDCILGRRAVRLWVKSRSMGHPAYTVCRTTDSCSVPSRHPYLSYHTKLGIELYIETFHWCTMRHLFVCYWTPCLAFARDQWTELLWYTMVVLVCWGFDQSLNPIIPETPELLAREHYWTCRHSTASGRSASQFEVRPWNFDKSLNTPIFDASSAERRDGITFEERENEFKKKSKSAMVWQ
jgi:hypothetical protein